MGLRKEYGGKIEDALNKLVDEKLDVSGVKKQLMEAAEKAISKLVDEQLEGLKHKIKADFIDLIDGENDID